MAISTVTNRVAYQGDGTSAVFAFPYRIDAQSHISVFTFNSSGQTAGVVTPMLLNGAGPTGFTFSGTPNNQGLYTSGGSVVFNSTPNVQTAVVIFRSSVVTSDFNVGQFGAIPATSLNNQLDYITMLIQREQDLATRSVRLQDGFFGTFDTTLPSNISQSAGHTIRVNSSATGFTLDPTLGEYIPNTVVIATTNSSITSLAGSIPGRLLTSNGSSAPSWEPFVLSPTTCSGILPIVNGGTGIGDVGSSNWLFGANAAATGFEYKAATMTNSGTIEVPSGQQYLGPVGDATLPSYSFATDTNTGFHSSGTDSIRMIVGGTSAFTATGINSSLINFGFGATPSGATLTPLLWDRSINGTITWQIGNSNAGNASVTSLFLYNGAGANYTQLENWANNTANTYLGGGSVLSSSPNQTQFIIAQERTASSTFIGIGIGGKTLATERFRLGQTYMKLNGGARFVMVASSSTAEFSLNMPNNLSTQAITWPAALPTVSSVFTTASSGVTSWTQFATTPYSAVYVNGSSNFASATFGAPGTVLTSNGSSAPTFQAVSVTNAVSTKTSTYTVTSNDRFIYMNGTDFNVNLTAAATAGQQITIRSVSSSFLANLGVVGSGVLINNISSTALSMYGEQLDLTFDGTGWSGPRNIPSQWRGYTPTINGFGSSVIRHAKWRRIGQDIELDVQWYAPSLQAITAEISLPNLSGISFAATGSSTIGSTSLFGWVISDGQASNIVNWGATMRPGATLVRLTKSQQTTTTDNLTESTGTAGFYAAVRYSMTGHGQILGWEAT